MNLAVNARDAMPQGGTLILETTNVDLDDAFPRTHPGFSPGRYVRLAVSDTGQGIDAATITRIFEPFFTTKPRGRGTGLGLATVHGIVKQSGGHIEVYSELGRGTSFKIYLPRCSDEAGSPDGPARSAETPRGSETILLVEDDEVLRDLIREMLTESGYDVLEAPDPEHGLRISREFAGRIHLLMTDVILPGISGNELAARVREIRPGLSVLFMSGYTDEAMGHHGVIGAGTQFLQKPFSLPVLLQKLRGILEG
jgi:CheY-like chemotaxis protein